MLIPKEIEAIVSKHVIELIRPYETRTECIDALWYEMRLLALEVKEITNDQIGRAHV